MIRLVAMMLLAAVTAFGALSDAAKSGIDRTLGTKGVYTPPEDVYKVSIPRTDVGVQVSRWPVQAFNGLASWAAFTSGKSKEALVMGDLALFEDEVNPVLSAALDNGLEPTALHNHYLFDRPRVLFLHFVAEGRATDLARAVRKCIDRTREIRAVTPYPSSQSGSDVPAQNRISADLVEHILGMPAQGLNGMCKITIGRFTNLNGREVGSQMGVTTWAAFAGTDENALVDGEFAMHPAELHGVLKALRASGIDIVAIHNHMSGEQPAFVFLHFWGQGNVTKLARGIRSGLDAQALSGASHLSHPEH